MPINLKALIRKLEKDDYKFNPNNNNAVAIIIRDFEVDTDSLERALRLLTEKKLSQYILRMQLMWRMGAEEITLPESIGELSNLRGLLIDAFHANLIFPSSFEKLNNLETLVFDRCKTLSPPNCIIEFNKLKRLHITRSKLLKIPDEAFYKMPNLISLVTKESEAERLPNNIFNLWDQSRQYPKFDEIDNAVDEYTTPLLDVD